MWDDKGDGSVRRARRTRRAIGLSLGIALISMVVAGCGAAAAASNGAMATTIGTATASATATQATTTGTTGGAQPHLGDAITAFTAHYGQPVTAGLTSGQFNYLSSPSADHPFLLVYTAGFFGETPATDTVQVDYRSDADNLGSLSHAEAACAAFLPSDAIKGKSVQALDSTSGKVSALDVLYTSATLAHTFPAADFQDASQGQAQPGSFDVQYLYVSENDPSVIADCSLELGTQQTQG